MKVARQALRVESYLFALWSNPNTFLPDKMYHQANSLSRFPCSNTRTSLHSPSGPLWHTGQALRQQGIFPPKGSTAVLRPCFRHAKGVKWDLSAFIFLSRSAEAEFISYSFLVLSNLPLFIRSPFSRSVLYAGMFERKGALGQSLHFSMRLSPEHCSMLFWSIKKGTEDSTWTIWSYHSGFSTTIANR